MDTFVAVVAIILVVGAVLGASYLVSSVGKKR